MNPTLKYIAVIILVASALGVATAFIMPHFRTSPAYRVPSYETGMPDDGADKSDSRIRGVRSGQTVRKNTKSLAERNKAKFDVGEMRNEAEDWIEKFRNGTPEERQEVIERLREDTALILMIADAAESSIENMTPDELEKERADFEKNYRAQLDYLKTGRLQRMLKTPEEQEVIGPAFEAAQSFLERLDAALNAVGY